MYKRITVMRQAMTGPGARTLPTDVGLNDCASKRIKVPQNMKPKTSNYCWLALLLATAGTLCGAGYRTSLGTAPDDFPVVVVSGTPYEMGLSLGTLMQPEIRRFVPLFLMEAQQVDAQEM